MSRPNTRFPLRNSVILTLGLGLLAACNESGEFVAMQGFKPNAATPGAPGPGGAVRMVERDIEVPEVFSATEPGLWDGRPSLGGVWVAHPDVTDPERVIIRNTANDKFVVGALFRRESNLPGPRLQISSDAAEALGILAGAPAPLNVTALRKEEVAMGADPEAVPVEADTVAPPSEVTATSLDPIQSAAAAIDAPTSAASGIAPAAAPEPTPVAARAAASNLDRPFIQIGIFSVEANATRTATQMRNAGVIPLVRAFERDGKEFWRVIVGPAGNASERSQLLTKIKSEGFTDAYAVSN